MLKLVKVAKENFVAVLGNVNNAFKVVNKKQGLFNAQLFLNKNGEVVAKKVVNSKNGNTGYQVAEEFVAKVEEKVIQGWELVKATFEEFKAVLSNDKVKVFVEKKKQGLFNVTLFKNAEGIVIAKKVENKTGGVGYFA